MKTFLRNLMITAFLVMFSSFAFAITQAQFNDAGTLLELGDTTNGFIVDGSADVYTSGDVNCVNVVNSGSLTSTGAMTVSTLTVTGYESVAGTMSVTGAMATAAITSSGLIKASSGSFSGTVYSTGTITSGGAIAGTTLDTGQGANELYDMDQNVLTTDAVTFSSMTLNVTGTGYGLTVSTGALFATGGGNVGIGTTNPQAKLEVLSQTGDQILATYDTNRKTKYTHYGINSLFGAFNNNMIIGVSGGNSGYGAIVFETNGTNERMRIDKDGKVGIMTITPTQALDVVGNTIVSGNMLFTSTTSSIGDASNYVGTIHLSTLTYHSLPNMEITEAEAMIRAVRNGNNELLDKSVLGRAYQEGGLKKKNKIIKEEKIKKRKDEYGVIIKDKKGKDIEDVVIEDKIVEYEVIEQDGMNLNYVLSAMLVTNREMLKRIDALNDRIAVLEAKGK